MYRNIPKIAAAIGLMFIGHNTDATAFEAEWTPVVEAPTLHKALSQEEHKPAGLFDAKFAANSETLSEIRGGFIDYKGIRFDFGFVLDTQINGLSTLRSALTLSDILNNAGNASGVANTSLAGESGVTDISHARQGALLGATISNSQSNLNIENTGRLTIDLLGIRQTDRIGALRTGKLIKIPRIGDAIRRSLAR